MELFKRYPGFQLKLDKVEQVIQQQVKSSFPLISDMLTELVEAGGKRLRPACVLLGGEFGSPGDGAEKEKLLKVAAAVEILHMATLIHDDIIDEASLRRGEATINFQFGKEVAVFSGDYLFCQAFDLLADYKKEDFLNYVSRIIRRICEGEIEQFFNRYSVDLSIRDYLRRIRRKTALLFGMSFFVGGKTAGLDDDLLHRLEKVGIAMGMGFQIIDDLLDVQGSVEVIGKDAMNDFSQGIYNFPIILRLADESDSGPLTRLLQQGDLSAEEKKEVYRLLKAGGYLERSRMWAERYFARAVRIIQGLPDIEARIILQDLVRWVGERNY
ncbi:MAG: polyprenyl synthetase family protein [Halanaerobium sp.]|nr:polyprenyl synthetase family protein [Halanaerobium sp.]